MLHLHNTMDLDNGLEEAEDEEEKKARYESFLNLSFCWYKLMPS